MTQASSSGNELISNGLLGDFLPNDQLEEDHTLTGLDKALMSNGLLSGLTKDIEMEEEHMMDSNGLWGAGENGLLSNGLLSGLPEMEPPSKDVASSSTAAYAQVGANHEYSSSYSQTSTSTSSASTFEQSSLISNGLLPSNLLPSIPSNPSGIDLTTDISFIRSTTEVPSSPSPTSPSSPSFLPTTTETRLPHSIGEFNLPTNNTVTSRITPGRLKVMEATTMNGEIVRFGRRQRKVGGGLVPRQSTNPNETQQQQQQNSYQVLGTPIHILMNEIQEDASLLVAKNLQEKFEMESSNQASTSTSTSNSITANTTGSLNGKGKEKAREKEKSSLWVDKYRPKKFTDLLGEERCNRDVLGWLKEWDRCVYKTVTRVKKSVKEAVEGEYVYHDPLGRPKDRILLLSGPPGLGKTTLAHIVAKSAGYDVLEINASDDRTASTVTSRIQNAIDAGSGLHAKGKPTCVIVDEIDGAVGGGDGGFVKSLVKLIQDVPASKKNKTPAKVLRRPIICICNDLYAPALRALRPFARIIRFKKAPPVVMVKRLREICEREGLKADTRGLTSLVEVTSSDVRTCLNTLQFINARHGEVNEKVIRTSTVGQKDAGASVHMVWNSLFVPITTRKKRAEGVGGDGKFVSRLAFTVQASGDYDKVVQGCFEHYPNLKPLDPNLKHVTSVHNWLHYYDRLSHRLAADHEWDLMGYLPYAIVPWYAHLASPNNGDKPVEFPKADYENYLQVTSNREIATALAMNIPPSLRGLYTTELILTELLPFVMRIISPNLRPVNAHLVKADEKATLARVVDLMISLNLRFYKDKNEDGQPVFRLDPAIDVFVHYEGKRASDIAASRFAIRQLVSQAIDSELAKRKSATVSGATPGTATIPKNVHPMFAAKEKQAPIKLKAGNLDAQGEKIVLDFFGRQVAKKVIAEVNDGDADPSDVLECIRNARKPQAPTEKFRVMYKFNEGSSSAVRKNVKISSLM